MNPTASIVIVTRNRGEEAFRAIKSSLGQEYEPLEVLVYDDASTDGTPDTVGSMFPEVRLFTSDVQQGYLAWRNRGFRDAIGEFVFSVDDDAYFADPKTVAKTVELFKRYPHAAAVALPFTEPRQDFQHNGRDCHVGASLKSYRGCAHALRREVALQLGGYREFLVHQGEERDYCLRLLDAGWSVIYGDSGPLVHLNSLKRSRARLDSYACRNTLLITWLNVPQPYVGPRLFIDSIQLLRYRLTLANLPSRLQLVTAGWTACLWHWKDRRPVRLETYRRFRSLPGHSPMNVGNSPIPTVLHGQSRA